MICLSLTGETREDWSQAISHNRRWIDLVELRVDMLKPAERGVEDLAEWWREVGGSLPCILTVRRSQDLGHWEGDEAQRLHLLNRLVMAISPSYIDIELDRVGQADWDRLAASVRADGATVIRSHHEARSTPEDLSSLMARLSAEPQEIPKLEVMAQSEGDTMRLVHNARRFGKLMSGREGIWIAMGEYGLPTRVWPAGAGSLLTYASDPGSAAAPGNVSPRQLREVYRVDRAGADWPAFAVIGSPVAHSRSPEYHNRRFDDDGINAIYLPLRLDSFDSFPDAVETYGLKGASVTVPHKEGAYDFAEAEKSTAAFDCGAANTLTLHEDGWHADNTDVPALFHSIREAVAAHLDRETGTLRVLVIGAGGAARAVLAALKGRVHSITLANRSAGRMGEVATRFGIPPERQLRLTELPEIPAGSFDLVIQTTSVGMAHGTPGDPSEGYDFAGSELAYDVVYTPSETEFLQRAARAGCAVVNGADMFERQGALQYEQFVRLEGPGGS